MTLHLSIEVDEPVRVGETFTATVIVEATKEHSLNGLWLTFEGEHPFDPGDEGLTRFLHDKTDLLGPTEIPPGRHVYSAEFTIPDDAPPSIQSPTVRYVLEAWAMVPWWFDVTERHEVRVVLPPLGERPAPRPVTVTSNERGREALFLELTLNDTTFSPGETITGSFSVGNTLGTRLDGATISVVPRPSAVAGALAGDSSVWKSLAGAGEGSVTHFAIPIPADTAPSCTTRFGVIAREVEVRIDGFSATCSAPITIGAYERRAEGTAEPAGPMGAVRWRFLWRDEGARLGLALEGGELRLRGTLADEVSVKVRPRGVGLEATLRWPSLGIGLSIEKRGILALAGVDLFDIDKLIADRFTVRGREEAQVRALFENDSLCSALLAFDDVKLDDGGARLESSRSARDQASLRAFLDALDTLARAIVAAAPRIPPPSWASPAMVETWKRFAEASGARFFPGRMAILGAGVDGDLVDIETVADERPTGNRVTLMLDPPLDREAPPGVEAVMLQALPARVEIHAERLVLTVAGHTDPEDLRAPIAELQRLARRLRGENERGPYR